MRILSEMISHIILELLINNMEGRNMKVKDLLNALKQYDPEAGVTLRLYHNKVDT